MDTVSIANSYERDLLPKDSQINIKSATIMNDHIINVHNTHQIDVKFKNDHVCQQCNKIFTRKSALIRHGKTHNNIKSHICSTCNRPFLRKEDLFRHMITHKRPPRLYICSQCNISFKEKKLLIQHQNIHKKPPSFKCKDCNEIFATREDLKNHSTSHRNCDRCNKMFTSKSSLKHHLTTSHRPPHTGLKLVKSNIIPPTKRMKLVNFQKALNIFKTYTFTPNEDSTRDLLICFKNMEYDIVQHLEQSLEEMISIKWYIIMNISLIRTKPDGEQDLIVVPFRSKTAVETKLGVKHFDEATQKITASFDEFVQRGSGWTLDRIRNIELYIAKYSPFAKYVRNKK